jgi:polysaccharide export outer membrane protein
MNNSPKIFIVDNDLYSLNSARIGLESMGYKDVSLYLNGTICLNNLHRKPNIIFLDNTVNHDSDFELLKKIKQYNSDTYVVIISKQETMQIAFDSISHGAFDYFVKGGDEISKMKKVIERIHLIKQ